MPAAKPFTITVLLVDGTPDGLRLIYRSNWNGLGVDFARADWPSVRKRPEFTNPGVYVLSGVDAGPQIYVGEADPLEARLNQHYGGPLDFWTRATAFISQGGHLNKAIIEYLEAHLYELAATAKRADLKNGNKPSMPSLSPGVEAEAAGFLEEMLPIYPLLGVSAFEVSNVAESSSKNPRLTIGRSGIVAWGRDDPSGFTVEAGSQARLNEQPSIPAHVSVLREKLTADGVLVPTGTHLKLTQDYVFSSPSTAAGLLLGRSANGRTEWHDDLGTTLKQIQAASAATSP
jgi:hypothetical protein